MRNPGQVLSRDQLLELVWGDPDAVEPEPGQGHRELPAAQARRRRCVADRDGAGVRVSVGVLGGVAGGLKLPHLGRREGARVRSLAAYSSAMRRTSASMAGGWPARRCRAPPAARRGLAPPRGSTVRSARRLLPRARRRLRGRAPTADRSRAVDGRHAGLQRRPQPPERRCSARSGRQGSRPDTRHRRQATCAARASSRPPRSPRHRRPHEDPRHPGHPVPAPSSTSTVSSMTVPSTAS